MTDRPDGSHPALATSGSPPGRFAPGLVFKVNDRWRAVLRRYEIHVSAGRTWLDIYADPADGATGPEEDTQFSLAIGTLLSLHVDWLREEAVELVVTDISYRAERSDTPEDAARAIRCELFVRLLDVLEAQRLTDEERERRRMMRMHAESHGDGEGGSGGVDP